MTTGLAARMEDMPENRTHLSFTDTSRKGCLICFGSEDLSSVFNWNTKRLLIYLEAGYTGAIGVSPHHVLQILHGRAGC
jgi:hypothetical protein